MEKPDANGYVNIVWPSKTIPHGGIFHARISDPNNYSTKEFLKVLLDEAKLAASQKQKSRWENKLRGPDTPPSRPGYQAPRRSVMMVRPSTSRRRSLSAIRESGVYDDDGYQPQKRGEDRDKLKQRLQHYMEYGDSEEQTPPRPAPATRVVKHVLPTAKEKKQDLLTQIRERAEWLAEMEELGAGAPHRDIIQDQIEERMRMLEALGCDSVASTPRSTKSGLDTARSYERLPDGRASARSVDSKASAGSKGSQDSQGKKKSKAASKLKREESVEAYKDFPKLRYSPRRRQ